MNSTYILFTPPKHALSAILLLDIKQTIKVMDMSPPLLMPFLATIAIRS